MSKKLNIIEAMKMPIGTKFDFEYISNLKIKGAHFIEILKGKDTPKILCWNGDKEQQLRVCSETSEIKLIEIQQPVSFMEVVNSDKKCTVKHPIVDIIRERKELKCNFESAFKNEEYLSLNAMLYILSYYLGPGEIREVIKDGKWYIEESEADSNE